jgi:hypothetical protein
MQQRKGDSKRNSRATLRRIGSKGPILYTINALKFIEIAIKFALKRSAL